MNAIQQRGDRVLVTGAAGFIGSHLAERLLRDGYHVTGVDSFTNYYPRHMKERNIARLRQHCDFTLVEGDLLTLDLHDLFLRGFSYVFHLAAQAGVRPSWGPEFDSYVHANIIGTQRLLEAAARVSPRKFVYASSSSVYGDAEILPTPEDARPQPVSPYGVTKLAGEHLCMLYARNRIVPVVCLRYFTVYGPGQRPDMAFHRFIEAILQRREIVVFGDGEQTRDFTYVGDVVEATTRAAFSDVTTKILNVGGGSRASINEVLTMLEDMLGSEVQRRYAPAQQGDARHTGADIRAAATALGYVPTTPLRQGLIAQLQWLSAAVAD